VPHKNYGGTKSTLPPSKKFPVIDVWSGISEEELSRVANVSLDSIEEAMILADVDNFSLFDDLVKVCMSLGFRCRHIRQPEDHEEVLKTSFILKPITGKLLIPRPPVVTIMGHVDHGKTTLLDSLRKSEIVRGEHGGITQHIGAFVVSLSNPGSKVKITSQTRQSKESIKNLVTILDTPGHAAFHSMRERGANVTDIVVLVIAADDGIMDQTVESLKFAKAANVPVVIAVNKIDKVNVNDPTVLEKIKRRLYSEGIVLEEDGGETQSVLVSALEGRGLNNLKESILALAETLDLKSFKDGDVQSNVIESQVDPERGRLATLLVRSGTLKRGDIIVSTNDDSLAWAKIRAMFDEFGQVLESVGPGFPVQVIGWKDNQIPEAGDALLQVSNEKKAKEYIQNKSRHLNEQKYLQDSIEGKKKYEFLEQKYREHKDSKRKIVESGEKPTARFWKLRLSKDLIKFRTEDPDADKKINVVLKADVNGSLEVLLDVIGSYPNHKEEVKVNIVHFGLGPATESDIELAQIFPNTFIYSFNVKNPAAINVLAKQNNISIKAFNVIYHLVNDIKKEIESRLPHLDQEVVIGEAVVLKVCFIRWHKTQNSNQWPVFYKEFLINEKNKKVPVAGCRVTKGSLKKGKEYLYKVIRGGSSSVTIDESFANLVVKKLPVSSLRHIKNEVDVITKDMDCGIRFDLNAAADRLSKEIQETEVAERSRAQNYPLSSKSSNEEMQIKSSSQSSITPELIRDLHFLMGDKIVCYQLQRVKQKSKWTPEGF
jgi:translation initiation factor IF-2